MVAHLFLLKPGTWLGEGMVNVVSQGGEAKFCTRWNVSEAKAGTIIAKQEVELDNAEDKTINTFTLSSVGQDHFLIHLHNDLFGEVFGKGIINDKVISWEFHGDDLVFEGFEICQVQPDGTYLTRAEYTSSGEPHTIISGKLWPKK